jgi:hypothetical protein
MIRIHPGYAAVLAIVTLPLLTCCCSADTSADSSFKTVQSSYDYSGDNRRTREWRSMMTALDKCHQSGFNNAEPAGPPQTTCMQGSIDGCSSYHATQVYDCVGMSN